MNLVKNTWYKYKDSIPRVSGDEPMQSDEWSIADEYSPRERG